MGFLIPVTIDFCDGTTTKTTLLRVERSGLGARRHMDLFLDFGSEPDTAEVDLPPHLAKYGVRVRNNCEYSGPSVLGGEREEGNVEYKLRLSADNPVRFQQLVTQLKFRLSEGGGTCHYYIGVEDNGHPAGLLPGELAASLEALHALAAEAGASAVVTQTPLGTEGRRCAAVVVRSLSGEFESSKVEIRVAVAGGVDGGKTTLVSVLSHGVDGRPTLDNGRGSARMAVLRHKHEIESGRTSSVSHRIVGYDAVGSSVLNYSRLAAFTPRELAAAATRLVRFADLGGSPRYSKTSLHGMTSTRPDYVMLCLCAAQGMSPATLERLAVAMALGVPAFVVLTKIDAVDAPTIHSLAAAVAEVVAAAPLVESEAAAAKAAAALACSPPHAPVVPIIPVSSVSGAGISTLHTFLSVLPPQPPPAAAPVVSQHASGAVPASSQQLTHFQVDSSMRMTGVGEVLSGVVVSGRVAEGDSLLLGPEGDGGFRCVRVASVHRAQVEVVAALAGQHATVALSGTGPEELENECDGEAAWNWPSFISASASAVAATGSDLSTVLRSPFVCRQGSGSGSSTPGSIASLSRLDKGAGSVEEREEEEGRAVATPALPCPERAYSSSFLKEDFKRQTSQRDLQVLGRSWGFARRLSGGSAPLPQLSRSSSGASPRFARKGAVLLGLEVDPVASHSFEALLVLFNGQNQRQQAQQWALLAGRDGSSANQQPSPFTVHCGGVRQAAQIVELQELDDAAEGQALGGVGWERALAGSRAAAAVLQASAAGDRQLRTARAVLRFQHRPEWMLPGSRLILVDCGVGSLAAAGVVVPSSSPS